MRKSAFFAIVAICLLSSSSPAWCAKVKESKHKCAAGREYYLYTPGKIQKGKKYWLVVGVHGYKGNGKGAAGLANMVKNGECIVLGPTFPSNGYQYLQLDTAKQLIDIFKDLKSKYNLHNGMILHGFSGGSQYVSRFAMIHPELVAGCSAHSGGTWGSVFNSSAVKVPFAVSCGQRDTSKMISQCKLGRLDWAKQYFKALVKNDFCTKALWIPRIGHQASPAMTKLFLECYHLSTRGYLKTKSFDRELKKLKFLPRGPKRKKIFKTSAYLKKLRKLCKKYAPPVASKPKADAKRKPSKKFKNWYINDETLYQIRRRYIAETLEPELKYYLKKAERSLASAEKKYNETAGISRRQKMKKLSRKKADVALLKNLLNDAKAPNWPTKFPIDAPTF